MQEKQVPYNLDAEQSVIGSMFLSRSALQKACENLVSTMFYQEKNGIIFDSIKKMYNEGMPLDLTTIIAELDTKKLLDKVGGIEYLSELVNYVPTAANIERYIAIIKEKATRRNLIEKATSIVNLGYDNDTDINDVLDSVEKTVLEITKNRETSEMRNIKDVLSSAHARLEYLATLDTDITGIPTGFVDLDKMTSGFQESQLIILGARPAMGKTAFGLNLAFNIAYRKKTVAIFNLEMSAEQLVYRMLASVGEVDSKKITTGKLTPEEWTKIGGAIKTIGDTNIFIDDSSGSTIGEIRSKCRRMALSPTGLDFVIIDYLQLVTGDINYNGNRQQEVSDISRSLKLLSLELKIPIVALAQLSRTVEARDDKRPMMSDLRESGSIEQDADIIAFLYRDDYYNKAIEEKVNSDSELIVSKHRNGENGTIELLFRKDVSLFVSKVKTKEDEI